MTTATARAKGTTIAYEVVGDGPAVVLVHGLTESRRMWDPLIEPLAADHTVVALDLPGHGESGESAAYDIDTQVSAVRTVVDATGIADPLLVGHSMGGSVVTAAAGALPCRGVVNVDQRFDFSASQGVARMEPALRGDEASFREAIEESFAPLAGALSEGERARIEGLRQPRQDVVLAIWAPRLEWSASELDDYVRRWMAGVTVPYLSLHGRDPGDEYAGWLRGLIPDATVEVWPDLGHYPHLVEPDRFLVRLGSFEKSTQGCAS